MTSSAPDVHKFTFDDGLAQSRFEERILDLKASHYTLTRGLVEAGATGLSTADALRISNAKSRNHMHRLVCAIRSVIGHTKAKPLLIHERDRYVLDAVGVTNIYPLAKPAKHGNKKTSRGDSQLTILLTRLGRLNSSLIREHLLTGPSAMQHLYAHLGLVCKRLKDGHRFTLVVPPDGFSLECLERLLRMLSLDTRGQGLTLTGFRVLIHEEAVTDFLGIDITNSAGASAYTVGAGTEEVAAFLLGKRTAYDYCRDLKRVYRLDTIHHAPDVIHFHANVPGDERSRIAASVQIVARSIRGAPQNLLPLNGIA